MRDDEIFSSEKEPSKLQLDDMIKLFQREKGNERWLYPTEQELNFVDSYYAQQSEMKLDRNGFKEITGLYEQLGKEKVSQDLITKLYEQLQILSDIIERSKDDEDGKISLEITRDKIKDIIAELIQNLGLEMIDMQELEKYHLTNGEKFKLDSTLTKNEVERLNSIGIISGAIHNFEEEDAFTISQLLLVGYDRKIKKMAVLVQGKV